MEEIPLICLVLLIYMRKTICAKGIEVKKKLMLLIKNINQGSYFEKRKRRRRNRTKKVPRIIKPSKTTSALFLMGVHSEVDTMQHTLRAPTTSHHHHHELFHLIAAFILFNLVYLTLYL